MSATHSWLIPVSVIPLSLRSSLMALSANSACGNSQRRNSSNGGPFNSCQPEAGLLIRIHSRGSNRLSTIYLAEKRGTLDASKESTKLTIQKIGGILKPLTPFLKDRGIVYLKDVKTEHLSAFQETWLGRLRKNRETGELVRQQKSQLGKQKNQEFLKCFSGAARSPVDSREPCRAPAFGQDAEDRSEEEDGGGEAKHP